MYASRFKLVTPVAFGILHAAASTPVIGQENNAMMELLLRPMGWRAEWAGPGGAGVTELWVDQITMHGPLRPSGDDKSRNSGNRVFRRWLAPRAWWRACN